MYRGGRDNQWSVWDRGTNAYVPRGTDPEQGGLPEWVPRCVSNVFATKIDGICSILDQSDPAKLWSPSTDDDADRATAEVAEDADPVLLEEINYPDSLRAELNKLIALTNGAALIVHYDNDPKYGMDEIPLLQCPTCDVQTTPAELDDAGSVCPGAEGDEAGCGTPADAFQPVIDPLGKPAGLPFARGKMCATLCPSFEYSLPSSARVADAKRVPWVLTHSEMAIEEVLARWPKAKDTIDRKGGREKTGGLQRAYARAMRQLSSPIRARQSMAAGSSGDGPVVYILHHDPIDDGEFYFPDGLLAVMCEDLILEHGPLPTQDDEGCVVKSVLIRTFAHSPGTAFAKPPGDDLTPLQISRNMTESLIQLILMHDAAPTTYVPLTVTLENQPSGRPGETVFYRSMVPGDKPHREQGVNPPEGLYRYLELIDQKFEEISKLNSVLAGARPAGDPTLGEVQILQERGMASFLEPLNRQVAFEKDLSRLLMWIAKRSAWSPRFRQVRGENGQWEVRQFTAADLNGKVDVQIDKQTAWPKSPLMRLLRISKAFELGVLPPAAQDPELQMKMLAELDLAGMKPSVDVDRKQIARALDTWKAAHTPDEIAPPDAVTMNLPLHAHLKGQFLKTEEFEELAQANPVLAQAMVGHVQQIQLLIQQAQMAAVAAQQGPPQPDSRTPAEKGDHSAVHQAIASGAIRPAGGEPTPNPLGDAVAHGALTPAGAVPPPVAGPSIDDLMAQGALTPAPQAPVAPPP